ncbi:MAG: putative baseplate assembly protein [Burkholderiales bacterium PBB5]|nr:MAG: putative baseplate assembly protein [Burkholderiales bacterium PBB5]
MAVPWLPASVRINANVVDASHGDSRQMASQPEVLGAGDGSAVFQAFTLRQGPLTHVSAASPSGTASTLAIRVAGVPWTEVPSLYGALPAARVYTTRLADDGTVTVQFGDGRTGARLPSGAENVQARYRVGLGSAGNLEAGQLSLLLTAQLGVKAVSNPLPSSGGTDGEGLERARRNAPLTVLTLERIVSLQDFEDFAAAYTGIGKARADGVWDGQQRLVVLSLAGVGGAPLLAEAPLWRNLASAIDAARPPHQPLVMAQGQVVVLPLRARLRVQGGLDFAPVAQAVRLALVAAFGFEARRFAQALAGSELVAVMQSVAGVDHVLLDAFGSGTRQSDLLGDPLGAATARRLAGVLQPAELLVLDPAGIDLTELSA